MQKNIGEKEKFIFESFFWLKVTNFEIKDKIF